LVKSVEEVEVEALPTDLPHFLDVDISKLTELHQNLHGSDIIVPKSVKIFIDPEMGIVTVMEPQKEEVVEVPAAEAPAEGAEGAAPTQTEGEAKEESPKTK
jgi:large subunit ribosomal protein L25